MKIKLTRADRKFIDKVDHMNHKQIHQLKLEKYIGHRYWKRLRVPKLSWNSKPLFYINDATYKIPKKNHKGYYTVGHHKNDLVLTKIKTKAQFDCYWKVRFNVMGSGKTSNNWNDKTLLMDNDTPAPAHYANLMNKKRSNVKKRVRAAKGIKPPKPRQPKSSDNNSNQDKGHLGTDPNFVPDFRDSHTFSDLNKS